MPDFPLRRAFREPDINAKVAVLPNCPNLVNTFGFSERFKLLPYLPTMFLEQFTHFSFRYTGLGLFITKPMITIFVMVPTLIVVLFYVFSRV